MSVWVRWPDVQSRTFAIIKCSSWSGGGHGTRRLKDILKRPARAALNLPGVMADGEMARQIALRRRIGEAPTWD
ncbi:hypothetical protein RRG08_030153 [Elysia crispata]|uniref:Uncharacterized protein n=1 Tax=Elysia crispata TaxID=231223 RepID=A0AAE0ZSC4_9GAST|nr:hypothetical protein RRG08_030153 [Elysia crispata]